MILGNSSHIYTSFRHSDKNFKILHKYALGIIKIGNDSLKKKNKFKRNKTC